MRGTDFISELEISIEGALVGRDLEAVDPWLEIAADKILETCRWLKESCEIRFDGLQCITAIDWFEPDPKKASKVKWEPHTEVVYHLWSTKARASLVLKVKLPRWQGDEPGKLPELSSVVSVWRGADWHEREVFDLSGVQFNGHPDLRRILSVSYTHLTLPTILLV